jgi:hypothetical protein
MRQRPRRTLKWVGTVVCLLIVAAFAVRFVGVLFYYPQFVPQHLDRLLAFYLVEGSLGVRIGEAVPSFNRYGLSFRNDFSKKKTWKAWAWYQRPRLVLNSPSKDSYAFVPLWVPFLLVFIPTAYLWYRDRRHIPPGHCQRCGYDLTRNESGRCPECGTEVPKEHRVGG